MQANEPLAVDAGALAGMLGVSRRHIERLDCAGKLPAALRLGRSRRWNVVEVRAWLAAGAPDRVTWESRRNAGQVVV